MSISLTKTDEEALKEARNHYIFSEETLKIGELIAFCNLKITEVELHEVMLRDNWYQRRAEIDFKQQQALMTQRKAKFLKRKMAMDDKVLEANDLLIDLATERLQIGDELRISDIEKLANAINKSQTTNNDIIISVLEAKPISPDENRIAGLEAVNLENLPTEVIQAILLAQKPSDA